MSSAVMIIRESNVGEIIKELKEQFIENDILIKIQRDTEFDKLIEEDLLFRTQKDDSNIIEDN